MVFMTIVEETIGRRSGLRPLALSVVAYQRSIRKVERMYERADTWMEARIKKKSQM